MFSNEQVLSIIRQEGPLLPIVIAKKLGTSLLIASAILSELTSRKVVFVTSLKIGGSPLYYLPEQADKLEQFISYLNEKDQRTVRLLKEKQVLDEGACDPLTQVSLSQIKDFAQLLQVTYQGVQRRFWKWRTLSQEEAQQKIREILMPSQGSKGVRQGEGRRVERSGPVVEKKKELVEKKVEQKAVVEKERKVVKQTKRISGKKKERQTALVLGEEESIHEIEDELLSLVRPFLDKNSITLLDGKVVKKHKEAELLVQMDSPVGVLHYFCKAKIKAKINEGDLSSAYLEGSTKKLPVLFLSTGEPTKKAKGLLEGDLKGIAFKQL